MDPREIWHQLVDRTYLYHPPALPPEAGLGEPSPWRRSPGQRLWGAAAGPALGQRDGGGWCVPGCRPAPGQSAPRVPPGRSQKPRRGRRPQGRWWRGGVTGRRHHLCRSPPALLDPLHRAVARQVTSRGEMEGWSEAAPSKILGRQIVFSNKDN